MEKLVNQKDKNKAHLHKALHSCKYLDRKVWNFIFLVFELQWNAKVQKKNRNNEDWKIKRAEIESDWQ